MLEGAKGKLTKATALAIMGGCRVNVRFSWCWGRMSVLVWFCKAADRLVVSFRREVVVG